MAAPLVLKLTLNLSNKNLIAENLVNPKSPLSDGSQMSSRFFLGCSKEKRLAHPISLVIWNKDARSKDYSHIAKKFRPSHADYTYQEKYGIQGLSRRGEKQCSGDCCQSGCWRNSPATVKDPGHIHQVICISSGKFKTRVAIRTA